MKYIGIDPSSTATGIAVVVPPVLVDYSVLRPQRQADAKTRIKWTCGQIVDIVSDEIIKSKGKEIIIVIEIPSAHVYDKTRVSHGLAVYGFAAGAIWAALDCNEKFFDYKYRGILKITAIEAGKWTGGFSKDRRKIMVETLFKNYNRYEDKGLDAMDAIALCVWQARNNGIVFP